MPVTEYMGMNGRNVKRFEETTSIEDTDVRVTGYRGGGTYVELKSYGNLDAMMELSAEQLQWFIDALTAAKETMESKDPITEAIEWGKSNPDMYKCGFKDEFTFWYERDAGWKYRTGGPAMTVGHDDDSMYAVLAKYY